MFIIQTTATIALLLYIPYIYTIYPMFRHTAGVTLIAFRKWCRILLPFGKPWIRSSSRFVREAAWEWNRNVAHCPPHVDIFRYPHGSLPSQKYWQILRLDVWTFFLWNRMVELEVKIWPTEGHSREKQRFCWWNHRSKDLPGCEDWLPEGSYQK